jgi:multimeric flavodoxin WrbA
MKIVCISGSPRRGGNTDFAVSYVVSELSKKLRNSHIKEVILRDLNIEPCEGCRGCMTSDWCSIEGDDFDQVFKEVLNADIVVEAAPIYWNSPPGIMKDFIDRTHAIYRGRFQRPMSGQKAFILSVAADSGFETHEDIMTSWLRVYGAQIKGQAQLLARESGDIAKNPMEMEKLKAFTRLIMETASAI